MPIKYSIIEPKQPEGVRIHQKLTHVTIRSRVTGTVRIIELLNTNSDPEKNVSREIQRKNLIEETLNRVRVNKEEADQMKIEWTRYDMDLAGLGISLIDFKPHELCYISFDSI